MTRRLIGALLFIAVALGAGWTSWRVLATLDRQPRTTDAAISAEVVRISAGLPGRIARVAVAENATVEQGDLLFALDDTALRLLYHQAEAQRDAAQAALADANRTSAATGENAKSAASEITRAETNLALAEATVKRLVPLAADGIASQQTLDEARTAAADARVSLEVARQTARAADELVTDTAALEATLRGAEAGLALAAHNLSLAEVRAPVAGRISGLSAAAGAWVLPEMPVMTLIDTETWHAEGFFRETDLDHIAVGQPVAVRVLSHPGRVIAGTVESLGWGVQGTDAITLPGQLPFVPQTTDWVRLAKRFPVRIALGDDRPDDLRLGASATLTMLPAR